MTGGGTAAALSPLLDLFYPPGCLCCGAGVEAREVVLCPRCFGFLARLPLDGCPRCGSPVSEAGAACGICARLTEDIELVRSAAWFTGPVPALIHSFKYGGFHRLASFFAELMAALPWRKEIFEPADILVPVPLHRWRRFRRGYNQSERLAAGLAALCGKEVAPDRLLRTRRTRSQTRLSIEERRLNVTGAFRVAAADRLAGSTVLLIDDVMTTGATLNACAAALKKAGAKRVLACTFARA